MTGTLTQQGSFVSAGTNVTLQLISGANWIKTFNHTKIAAEAVATGYVFEAWQGTAGVAGGLANGSAWEWLSNAGATAVNLLVTTTGVTFGVNSATSVPGAPVAITAISNATPPLVSTGSTAGLSTDNGVVEIINTTGVQQFGGIQFSIGTVVLNTSFTLKWAPTVVAGTNGFYRIIPFDPIFYPVNRYISAITVGATTQVQMTVTSQYIVGQLVRLIVPAAYGSISQNINGLTGSILSINAGTNTITLDINSTGMGAFVFPLTAAVPFTPAQVVPVGRGTNPLDLTNLVDATENDAVFGVTLTAGTFGPAGVADDVIYWQAGTVFNM